MARHTARTLALGIAASLVTAVTAGTSAATGPAATAADLDAADLRVGSFNVVNVSLDGKSSLAPWRERRSTVVGEILGQGVDVVGIQEVNPSPSFAGRLEDGPNQIQDLLAGLNQAGGSFALTNDAAFNCVRPWTQHNCEPQNHAATHSDRIYYDTTALDLVRHGGFEFDAQKSTTSPQHAAWAVLRMKDNGAPFLFVSTHLEPKDRTIREAQWRQLIRRTNKLKGSLPVVAVGDFNTQKFDALAATMYPAMKKNGYGDVLNQRYQENPVREPRAQRTVNAWVNSLNKKSYDVPSYAYEDARHKVGNSIDMIFAANTLPVQEYELVLDFDPSSLWVNGLLPSDHNMVRATLSVPAP